MNSVRCDACSLLNFSDASVCKRCGAAFAEGSEAASAQFNTHASEAGYNPYNASASGVDNHYRYDTRYIHESPKARKGKSAAVLLAIVAIVAVVGIPWYMKGSKSSLTNASWREFRPDNDSFSVLMPSEPKKLTFDRATPEGSVQGAMYYVETDDKTALAVGSTKLPVVPQNIQAELFDRACQSLSGRSGLTYVSRKNITLDGYQGVEWEVKPPASANKPGDKGMIRIFWAAPRFYMVMIGGPDSPEAAAVRTKYLDSFKIYASR